MNEDINDALCEEIAFELQNTKQKVESIKLAKNKITDEGLK